jgi:uncharacterized membrane protein
MKWLIGGILVAAILFFGWRLVQDATRYQATVAEVTAQQTLAMQEQQAAVGGERRDYYAFLASLVAQQALSVERALALARIATGDDFGEGSYVGVKAGARVDFDWVPWVIVAIIILIAALYLLTRNQEMHP